ncbi:MAG: hypothetical protein ACRC26_03405 [Bacteroidales bacterium]
MKKNLFRSMLILLMGTFVFYSCSSKDDVPVVDDEKSSVTFEFDANTLVSQTKAVNETPDPATTLCLDNNVPLSVQIIVEKAGAPTTIGPVNVSNFNGKLKTDPYELPAGTYTVMSVIVYNTSNPSQIIYSGVLEGAPFAKFVPDGFLMQKQSFEVLKYTKPTVNLYVLCARNYTATEFGMPKFELNRIEVTCFDLFFNVCDNYSEHFVGEGTIKVLDKLPDNGGKVLYSDEFGNGNIATICFADNMEIKDNTSEKYQIQAIFKAPYAAYSFIQQISVADLLNFRTWGNFDPSMNAVHVVLCDPNANPKVLFPGYPNPAAN